MRSSETVQGFGTLTGGEVCIVLLTLEEIEDLVGEGKLERALQRMLTVARDLDKRGITDEYRKEVMVLKGEYSDLIRAPITGEDRRVTKAQLMTRTWTVAKDMAAQCRHAKDRHATLLTFPLCCFDQISCWLPKDTP